MGGLVWKRWIKVRKTKKEKEDPPPCFGGSFPFAFGRPERRTIFCSRWAGGVVGYYNSSLRACLFFIPRTTVRNATQRLRGMFAGAGICESCVLCFVTTLRIGSIDRSID